MKCSDVVGSFTAAQLTVPQMLPPELMLSGSFEISNEMRAMKNGLTLPSFTWCCQNHSRPLIPASITIIKANIE